MLDLQPRVHLEKVEAAVLAGDEFDRPRRIVADRLGERDRLFAHLAARRLVEQRRGRLLDHLLVAALDRAFALAQIDDVAVLVAEHLDFDMAGIDDEFLDEDAIVAERGFRLRLRAREAFGDLPARMGDPHALAAAARRGLDHHGIADLVGDPGRMLGAVDHAEIAGHGRHVRGVREFLGFDLVAHRLDRAAVGADEDDAGLLQRGGESRAFGEKAIAGMDRLGAGLLAGGDDLLDGKVGFGRGRRPDRDRLVGHLDVQRVLVGFRIDRDGRNPQPPRGLDDPAGDLAAIGDQDFAEHRPPVEGSAGERPRGPLLWEARRGVYPRLPVSPRARSPARRRRRASRARRAPARRR